MSRKEIFLRLNSCFSFLPNQNQHEYGLFTVSNISNMRVSKSFTLETYLYCERWTNTDFYWRPPQLLPLSPSYSWSLSLWLCVVFAALCHTLSSTTSLSTLTHFSSVPFLRVCSVHSGQLSDSLITSDLALFSWPALRKVFSLRLKK